MNESRLHLALRTIHRDLENIGARYALIGGLAVSARAEPRFTRDLDLAVTVSGDAEAETLVRSLRSRGYVIETLVEQDSANRLATVRLVPPEMPSIFVDLLFASSGIEPEIVACAEQVELIEGMVIRIATVGHLIATKVLSRDDRQRPQDHADLAALLRIAGPGDVELARQSLIAIRDRGFHRGKDLLEEFETLRG